MIFRHEILDDGRVFVNLNGHVAHLPPGDVRRFAWGVLADLDPEGAEDAGYQPPAIVLGADLAPKVVQPGPWQRRGILAYLAPHDEASTPAIAKALGISNKTAAVQLSKLRRQGHVRKISEGMAYSPASWVITDHGRALLKRYVERDPQSSGEPTYRGDKGTLSQTGDSGISKENGPLLDHWRGE